MTCLPARRPGRATVLLAGLLALVAAVVPARPSQAETAAQAAARAQALLAQVRALQAQTVQTTGDYDRALAGLAGAVNGNVRAGQQAQEAERAALLQRQRFADRVRGVYISGGRLAMYATVMDAASVSDLMTRAVMVGRVLQVDKGSTAAVDAAAGAAARHAASAARDAAGSIRTERSVSVSAARLADLLAQQARLLAAAQVQVGRLRAEEEARRAAEEARREAERLAAALAAQRAAAARVTATDVATATPLPAGMSYLDLYKAAAPTCPGLSWTVLAAIGQVESGHGRDVSTSSAGAQGPMQFLPSTFAMFAVDGDHDGRANIMDPADAIFTAARYLCSNGAGTGPQGLYTAIWNYNHADWYVRMVLSLAAQYR